MQLPYLHSSSPSLSPTLSMAIVKQSIVVIFDLEFRRTSQANCSKMNRSLESWFSLNQS